MSRIASFQGSDLFEATQISFGLAIFGSEEGFNEVPGHRRSNSSTAHAKDVHVVVFDALPGRKMIVDQAGPNALDLVGADHRADAAATNRYAAINLARCYGVGERNDEVGIIVIGHQTVRAEIHCVMAGRAQLADKFLFQIKSTVIGSNAHAHNWSFISFSNH